MPAILIRAALDAIAARDDMRTVAVCVPYPCGYGALLRNHLRDRATRGVQRLFNPRLKRRHGIPLPLNLNRLARRCDFEIVVPPRRDINDPEFIARLREEFRPTLALSFFCVQRFSPELLALFEQAVNYHNGRLPDYKGMRAPAWSVYNGEEQTGFAFHRMTAELDQGDILIEDATPIGLEDGVHDIEIEKARRAAGRMSELLGMVADNAPGRPQQGAGRYFSNRRWRAVRTVGDPSALTLDEFNRRLRAFGSLSLKIGGRWYPVTAIEDAAHGSRRPRELDFVTADGVTVRPVRIRHLPPALYRFMHRFMRAAKEGR